MLKHWIIKKISLYLVIAIFILNLAPNTYAQSNADLFDTKLETTVTVSLTGQSKIKHQFTITNKTPTTYIKQYGLKITANNLGNPTVISNDQAIIAEVNTIANPQGSGPKITTIGITFPDKIVGEGKSRTFSISYTHPDAAIISGSVLEVSLAPQANPEDYSQYKVTLITPAIFGGPVRTTPAKNTYTASGNQIITTFSQEANKGIFALFGNQQIYQLNLDYHLENSTNNPVITQIALPPDTPHQRLSYQSLKPLPQKIEVDQDGNWIATYQLAAGNNTIVKLIATALVTLDIDPTIPTSEPTQDLIKSQPYWPTQNTNIIDLAKQYPTAEAINKYVVKTMSYNTNRALNNPERLGGLSIIDQPDQAVCQEFTDSFITIARAASIPARRITGYAYTKNSELRPLSLVEDILHAWPDYYNFEKQQWIPIDPTWENTTGGIDYFNQVDLNHLVFAINGRDSQLPYPAGSYKNPNSTLKTVNVDFGTKFPQVKLELTSSIQAKKIALLKIPGLYILKIQNLTGQAYYGLNLQIETTAKTKLINPAKSSNINLLPFQILEIPLYLENPISWLPGVDTIGINVQNYHHEYTITTSPRLKQIIDQPNSLIGLAIGLIISTLIAGSVLVFRKKNQNSLRR